MAFVPEVRFTRSGTADIAYQIVGEGPVEIVLMIGWVSHLEMLWELPEARRFIERFSSIGRVALFDKRGTGLSDRPSQEPTGAELAQDVLAVMDAAGIQSAALVGWVDAATVAIEVAAFHPDRVDALILGETLATTVPDQAHPWGPNEVIIEKAADAIENGSWGQAVLLPMIAPSVEADDRVRNWFMRMERMAATPSMAANLLRRTISTDVRELLDSVSVPALVLHRSEASFVPTAGVRWLAEHLPQGRYVELAGDEVPGYLGDVDALMDEIEEFLVGTRTGGGGSRRVLTVVFSDIVGSTERVAAVGDRRWRDLLEDHRREARRLIARHGGTEIDTAGDGFLVSFESPSAALRFGLALQEVTRQGGLEVRVGVHSGEVVVHDADLVGLAVHLGARVASQAAPGEVWVSQTVKELLIGSEFRFSGRGRHALKGVPGEWELFRVDR